MKFTVALIYGGEGLEHEISLVSAENIRGFLEESKCETVPVFISKEGEWFIEKNGERLATFPVYIHGVSGLFSDEGIIPVDLAIPSLHGDFGEDGTVAGLLSSAHIRFLGCGVLAGAVCSDKITAKMIAEATGIPTAKWTYFTGEKVDEARKRCESLLGYPIFIKPASLGSSIGISRVDRSEDFAVAYGKALGLSKRILVEEAIEIECELECAYLGLKDGDRFAVGRVLSEGKFYGFREKYTPGVKTEPVERDEKISETVISMAKILKEATGISEISRLDFFLTKDGKILFNEINTFPGMTATSLYPVLTEKMGFSRGEFINKLLEEALL